jgi:hypothetical protein
MGKVVTEKEQEEALLCAMKEISQETPPLMRFVYEVLEVEVEVTFTSVASIYPCFVREIRIPWFSIACGSSWAARKSWEKAFQEAFGEVQKYCANNIKNKNITYLIRFNLDKDNPILPAT